LTAQKVEELRDRFVASVGTIAPAGVPWLMLDYPSHANCGDAALWLGQLAAARAVGARVVASYDKTFPTAKLRGDGILVLQAGGNFGGLYPTHHEHRLDVLAAFPGRPVLQMPQSIEFRDAAERDRLRSAISRHGNFTLMVRDQRSFDVASRAFDCAVHLVPDAAFALGPLRRPRAPRTRVVYQRRTDREAPEPGATEVESFDWLNPTGLAGVRFTASLRLAAMAAIPSRAGAPVPLAAPPLKAAFNILARASVRRGSVQLARGRYVVTDRLHGHILCVLLGIPHVVVNDRNGKIDAMWRTWTSPVSLARYAATWSEAPLVLDELISSLEERG
jgi:exopolysaccharide biosynthesis predicted pyruvyltransferase EpsI